MEKIMVDKEIYLQKPTISDVNRMSILLKEDMPNLLEIFEWAKKDYEQDDEINSITDVNNKILYIYYDNNPCGKICLYDYNQEFNMINIYYYIASPYRHKGIAYKSLWATLGYTFNTLGINEVLFFVNDNNENSLNLVKRMGFKEEGLLKDQDFINGKYHNQFLFSFSARDYEQRFGKSGNLESVCKAS